MRAHDDTVFPGFFRTGWKAGVSVVQEHYPELNPTDNQSPDDTASFSNFVLRPLSTTWLCPEASTSRFVTEGPESFNSESDSGEESNNEYEEGGNDLEVGVLLRHESIYATPCGLTLNFIDLPLLRTIIPSRCICSNFNPLFF